MEPCPWFMRRTVLTAMNVGLLALSGIVWFAAIKAFLAKRKDIMEVSPTFFPSHHPPAPYLVVKLRASVQQYHLWSSTPRNSPANRTRTPVRQIFAQTQYGLRPVLRIIRIPNRFRVFSDLVTQNSTHSNNGHWELGSKLILSGLPSHF